MHVAQEPQWTHSENGLDTCKKRPSKMGTVAKGGGTGIRTRASIYQRHTLPLSTLELFEEIEYTNSWTFKDKKWVQLALLDPK